MLVILFCNLVCVYEYIYVMSSLAFVVFFIVILESKRLPGSMKENIRTIFVSSCELLNFESNRIAGKRSNIRNFKYELNIRPILNIYKRNRRIVVAALLL